MCAACAAPCTAALHGWTEKEASPAHERYRIWQRLVIKVPSPTLIFFGD
jgi:hypothetical protein